MENLKEQGQRIKEIRQKLGLSQEEFGKIINVSKQYVSNLEAGRNALNNDKLVSLLVDHNISSDFILAGIGSHFVNSKAAQYEDMKPLIHQEIRYILNDMGIKGING